MTISALRKEALRLSAEERTKLIDALWESLDTPARSEMDKAWGEEAERRIEAHDRGEIQSVEGTTALKELKKRFSR
ncbi:MAG: addiction module protein [Acidobacteriota bacterium]